MSETTWFEITLELPEADVETATDRLAEAGHTGTELRELGGETAALVFYVQAADQASAEGLAEAACAAAGAGSARVSGTVDEAVWTTNWQSFFPRMPIGERLELLPPWEDSAATEDGRIPVVINPGNAFGTGQHETTACCLELIEERAEHTGTMADIGCGSGVLAIASVLLGAQSAVGIDNDPDAVNASEENAVTNSVDNETTFFTADTPDRTLQVKGAAGGYDLVAANIFAENLIEMREALTSCVKRGGYLVLSGIESPRLPMVEDAFSSLGWVVCRRLQRGEWSTAGLMREADAGISADSDTSEPNPADTTKGD